MAVPSHSLPTPSHPAASRPTPPSDLRGWFIIDIVSVLPFWAFTLVTSDPWDTLNAGLESTGSMGRATVLIRIVKLLRMLKLARVLKASRVMQRVLLDVVMNHWEVCEPCAPCLLGLLPHPVCLIPFASSLLPHRLIPFTSLPHPSAHPALPCSLLAPCRSLPLH